MVGFLRPPGAGRPPSRGPAGGWRASGGAAGPRPVPAFPSAPHGARRRLPLQPPSLAAAGVLLALASGLPALLEGLPYLTHPWITMPLGATGLPLSTVMLFDLGVYCCVWGAIGGYCLELLGGQEGDA